MDDEADVRPAELLLVVPPVGDEDPEELADLVAFLRDDLLDLDVATVERVTGDEAPSGSKGAVAAIAGWLAVNLGSEALKAVVNRVVEFATRHDRTVELDLDGDVLKVSGLDREQQNRLIDEWLARQAASA